MHVIVISDIFNHDGIPLAAALHDVHTESVVSFLIRNVGSGILSIHLQEITNQYKEK
jgi:hypothetical protein